MFVDYFYWQYWAAPKWLAIFLWNIQRVIWRYFSVPVIARTVFSHWRRDAVSYQASTISGYLKIFVWNIISRVVGAVVRLAVLVSWLITEIIFIPLSLFSLVAFVLLPWLAIASLAIGVSLILVP